MGAKGCIAKAAGSERRPPQARQKRSRTPAVIVS